MSLDCQRERKYFITRKDFNQELPALRLSTPCNRLFGKKGSVMDIANESILVNVMPAVEFKYRASNQAACSSQQSLQRIAEVTCQARPDAERLPLGGSPRTVSAESNSALRR